MKVPLPGIKTFLTAAFMPVAAWMVTRGIIPEDWALPFVALVVGAAVAFLRMAINKSNGGE